MEAEVKLVRKKQKKKDILVILSFMLPALFVYTIFILYPIITTFNYSLFDWNGMGERVFVGLQNYTALLSDNTFWHALKNNAYLILVSVFVQIPLGLIMALVLFSSIRGKKVLNVLFFLPYLMSTVAVGLLWIFMFDPVNGPVNKLLNFFSFESIHWLSGSNSALIAILIVMAWQFAPFYMILFKAAMVGIPEELYEAAEIDGANGTKKFFYVTLPSLMPTIVSSSILAVVGSLKTFDLFYVMTGGGSGNATEILGTYMYRQAFVNFKMGYGSTIAAMMFIIALVCAVGILFLDFKRRKKQGVA
ncbi:ABC transporter permease [Mesobacillus campisalis]|uniref:ABC transporter permease n=2 Tax=Mesobacillus campisalis TaxID=1408103 RepID=A0A0M2T0H2_9BACI|nr:ABC transporter permease [Mesobacillus campisalis]